MGRFSACAPSGIFGKTNRLGRAARQSIKPTLKGSSRVSGEASELKRQNACVHKSFSTASLQMHQEGVCWMSLEKESWSCGTTDETIPLKRKAAKSVALGMLDFKLITGEC